MSPTNAPPNLALPHTSQHFDIIIGSQPPALCSPTEAVQHRPIHIISPDVIYEAEVGTSQYVQHGPDTADPLFAFSFLDNLIVNDASKHTTKTIRDQALVTLRFMATLGRGRAFEHGLGNRRAVCGLYPRQIYENALNHIYLERIDFNKLNDNERAYARAIAYVNLASALRQKYPRQRIVLVLGTCDEDKFVHQYAANHFAASFAADHIAVEVAPIFPAASWPGHENETWYPSQAGRHWRAARPGDKGPEPSWEDALDALAPKRPMQPFIIAVDTNSIFTDRVNNVPRNSNLGDYLVYSANTSNPNICMKMPKDVVDETNRMLNKARLPAPKGQWWAKVQLNKPTSDPVIPRRLPGK